MDGEQTRHAVWERVDRMIASLESQTVLRYPVYIPSKARSQYRLVTELLDRAEVDYRLVVEPQDEADYRRRWADRVLTLPQNDQGISYVRNWCKDHAAENGAEFHWQMDDDIPAFRVRRGGKGVPVNPRHALSVVEQTVDLVANAGGAGLSSSAFVFSYDNREPLVFNTMVYVAMLLRSRQEARFRDHTGEDTDFSMQMLTNGLVTLAFKRLCFDTAPTEKWKGGNTDVAYAGNGRLWRFERTVALWPNNFKIGYLKDGRPRLQPTRGYRDFTQHPQPSELLLAAE